MISAPVFTRNKERTGALSRAANAGLAGIAASTAFQAALLAVALALTAASARGTGDGRRCRGCCTSCASVTPPAFLLLSSAISVVALCVACVATTAAGAFPKGRGADVVWAGRSRPRAHEKKIWAATLFCSCKALS